jgi:hypothetical protein
LVSILAGIEGIEARMAEMALGQLGRKETHRKDGR